jgi:hypothetical protein
MNPNYKIARMQNRIEEAEREWKKLKDQMRDTDKHLFHLLFAVVLQTAVYGVLVYMLMNR